jgi:hypothetical protein
MEQVQQKILKELMETVGYVRFALAGIGCAGFAFGLLCFVPLLGMIAMRVVGML